MHTGCTMLLFCLLLAFMIIFNVSSSKLFKGLASACFLISAAINFFMCEQDNKPYSRALILALLFAFIADVVIIFNGIAGGVLFAVGHIFSYYAFCRLDKPSKRDILPTVFFAAVALCVCFFTPFLKMTTIKRILCVLYALVISTMAGKAVSNHFEFGSVRTLILFIAAVAFYASDIMVLLYTFGDVQRDMFYSMGRCMYFIGQFVLAQGLYTRR